MIRLGVYRVPCNIVILVRCMDQSSRTSYDGPVPCHVLVKLFEKRYGTLMQMVIENAANFSGCQLPCTYSEYKIISTAPVSKQ